MNTAICTFYRFLNLPSQRTRELKAALESAAERLQMRGLILLSEEGINGTVSGTPEDMVEFKQSLLQLLSLSSLNFKDSVGEKNPFQVFKVKVKEEIVTLGKPELRPPAENFHHLSPKDWHEALQNPDALVLDTRNTYEINIGKFKSAVDFQLSEFNEFPEKLKAAGIAKERPVLMYCTGGIRCEKAILEMHEQGYKNVHQLEGGILNYLREYPHGEFEGECFVFDYRVAVDQNLQPSTRYRLCPHCGQAADQKIECIKCGREETLCADCAPLMACSKNCAHHHEIGSNSKKVHIPELKKRHRQA